MFLVGLTGGIGSGKTAVSDLFRDRHGISIIDADQLAREVVAPGQSALDDIKHRFGDGVLNRDGTLNRPALRGLVFENQQDRVWLESLLHPKIRALTEHYIANSHSIYAINVIPLLVETNRIKDFDRILVVDCSPDIQLERTMKRDRLTKEQAESILNSQATRSERLAIADDVLVNDGDISDLNNKIDQLHHCYRHLAIVKDDNTQPK